MGRRQMHPQREELGDPRRLRPVLDGADPRAVKNIAAAPGVHRQPRQATRQHAAEEAGDGGAADQSAPPPDATPILDDTAIAEIAAQLQRVWPSLDGHGFVRKLADRFPDGIPEAAGVALRAWVWWAGQTPRIREGSENGAPPEGGDAPEPEDAP